MWLTALETTILLMILWSLYLISFGISRMRVSQVTRILNLPLQNKALNFTIILVFWSLFPLLVLFCEVIEHDLIVLRTIRCFLFIMWIGATAVAFIILTLIDKRLAKSTDNVRKKKKHEEAHLTIIGLLVILVLALVAISWGIVFS